MSSPFPSELTAAAHGGRVAWVFDAKGVRNVWVADGPDFIHTARQLTHYSADDGQPIASLRLTPDGATVLYALGSELNDAQGREGHSLVAVYDFDGGSIRYLAPSVDKDSMPRWSSDSKWIVFVRAAGDEAKLPLIPVRAQPWSLWIADAVTGTGRLLWRSGEKIEDSLPRHSEDGSLNVAADGRVIFSTCGAWR